MDIAFFFLELAVCCVILKAGISLPMCSLNFMLGLVGVCMSLPV